MTRYFFHIRQRDERIEDYEGHDFQDLSAALVEARAAAREIIAEDLRIGRMDDTLRFEITDETGVVVATFPFRDAIDSD